MLPEPVQSLINELKRLPGVGEKTATRYVMHMMAQAGSRLTDLAGALVKVSQEVRSCAVCGFLAAGERCRICADPMRDVATVCVVEGIGDLMAIERVSEYRGLYHVLGGSISVLRGITPDKLRIRELEARVAAGGIREVIVATSADAEGETTALYVRKILERHSIRVTRPATGIPMGSSLEYLDSMTLMRAMRGRKDL